MFACHASKIPTRRRGPRERGGSEGLGAKALLGQKEWEDKGLLTNLYNSFLFHKLLVIKALVNLESNDSALNAPELTLNNRWTYVLHA